MANYNRAGAPRDHSRNFIPGQVFSDIQPDYDDGSFTRSGLRQSRGRSVTGRQSPVDYIRGVGDRSFDHTGHQYMADNTNRGRERENPAYSHSREDLQGRSPYQGMDPRYERETHSPGMDPRYERETHSPGMDPRYERETHSPGMDPRYERETHSPGMDPRYERETHSPGMDPRYERENQNPMRSHSPQGSGGYDNRSYTGPHDDPPDDYERGRGSRSPEVVQNQGYMADNGGYDHDTRDAVIQMQGRDVVDQGSPVRYRKHNGLHLRDFDEASVYSIDYGHSDSHNVWDKLHTIRLRRKSQKSRKTARTLSRNKRSSEHFDGEDREINEGILPSLQNRVKPKSLHERLLAVRSTPEVAETLRDSANQQTGVSSVKNSIKQTWQKNRSHMKGWLYQFELWASTFKEIEGRFGTATVAYFRFTRWLMLLNLYIFLLMFSVVVIPFLALPHPETFSGTHTEAGSVGNNSDKFLIEAHNCSENYAKYIETELNERELKDKVLDFVQGTGWMERTSLFYGMYYNRTFTFPEEGTYNMSLAYLLTTIICFLVSFILIVKNSGKSVKEAVTDQESSKTLYCNKVFCSWDYCITNEKAAKRKKLSYKREIEDDLKEERWKQKQKNRTTKDKCRLFFVRLFVNLLVLCILGASLYLIYYTTDTLLDLEKQELDQVLELFIQYLPSLAITVLNFLVPLMFAKIVIVENYGGSFELKITLVRTVLLRLASLGVLIISLYIQLLSQENDDNTVKTCGNYRWEDQVNSTTVKSIKCWETYVGQQFYKLALLDFVSVVLLTFFVEFPRKLVYEKLHQKLKIIKLVGEQEFDLPKNVLDIVYSQTLCWLGMFFTPMIPAITLLKVFIIFYVKRLTVLHNCIPPIRPYRASRSNSFFMTVLLFSFILAVIPVGYIIGNISPSQSCGPFRWYSSEDFVMFNTITNTVNTMNEVIRSIFNYLGTVAFFVPAIILLCLLMYYYWAASQGYKKMEKLLKNQLKLEGRDRQFLLSRMNEVIQRGELSSAANG